MLTGEVGTGKTTLINKLLEWLRLQQVRHRLRLQLADERPAVPGLHDGGLRNSVRFKAKSQILLRLYNWLLDRYRAGETAVSDRG